MTVTCSMNSINESALLLPTKANMALDDDNFVVLMGYTVDSLTTEYHISVGVEYQVYGILFHKNQIRYLVQDDDARPIFCPDQLFRVQQANVSWDWEIESFVVDDAPLALVGYPAMEGGYDELIKLAFRENAAVKRFLKYKDYLQTYGDVMGRK